MSDHIPIEIQIEIIRRLPAKSVIRFACVSKQLKSLIHSSKFVNDHYSLHTQQQKQQPLFFVAERDAREPYRSFAFDTFGFLAPEAVELLGRIQRVMHSYVMTPRSINVVFKRLGFAIQKGLAAQLVARLPSIPM